MIAIHGTLNVGQKITVLGEQTIEPWQPRRLLHETIGRSVQQGLGEVEGVDDPATTRGAKIAVQHVLVVTRNDGAQLGRFNYDHLFPIE